MPCGCVQRFPREFEGCKLMDEVTQFYTLGTLMTLTGAAGATFVITNGLQNAFTYNPRWLGLLVAFVVTLAPLVVLPLAEDQTLPQAIFVGICNAFLVFATAGGVNEGLRQNQVHRTRKAQSHSQGWKVHTWFPHKT